MAPEDGEREGVNRKGERRIDRRVFGLREGAERRKIGE